MLVLPRKRNECIVIDGDKVRPVNGRVCPAPLILGNDPMRNDQSPCGLLLPAQKPRPPPSLLDLKSAPAARYERRGAPPRPA